MRPAWLPTQPAVAVASPCHGRPRSAASRPHSSAANSPPRDAMVLSARQHLQEPAARAQHESTPEAFVSLREFMDSFPLVPLAIIPRLCVADLIECETGLRSLYESLAVNTNAEDARLGTYITRQLGLVQRHMEDARARERVLKLLSGAEPVELNAVENTSRSAIKPLPVFLQPPQPAPNHPVSPVRATKPPPPGLTATKSTSALPVKKAEPSNQLNKAKAVAKATLTTAFVITTRENSLKARQKRVKKKTAQQIEEEKAKQQEKEKEKRRQEAYQRLLARQALQARKKQEALDKKKKQSQPAQAPEVTMASGSFVEVTEPAAPVPNDTAADSSSDESEVSNCSENDEADERAILDMPVEVKVEEEEPPDQVNDETSEDPADEATLADSEEEANDEDDERVESGGQAETSMHSIRDAHVDNESRLQHEPETDSDADNQTIGSVASAEHRVHLQSESTGPIEAESPEVGDNAMETEAAQEQRAREVIALQLQQFVAEKTQCALDQLRSRQSEARQTARLQISQARTSTPPTAVKLSSVSPRSPNDPASEPRPVLTPPCPLTASSGCAPPPSPTKKRPLPHARSQPSPASPTVPVLRSVGREVQDYRSYFANFFCILTSVYEQRMAFTSGSSGGTGSSSSSLTPTIAATTNHNGDQALRLQLKLYQSWATIMNDYATVFGNAAPTSSSTTASSSYTAHYRINSQSRKEVNDIVVTALDKLGDWEEHPSGLGLKTTWNLLWTWSKPNVERKTLLAWQKVNHFQHAKALTRKDCLKKNIGKYQAMGGRLKQAYDIVPASFLLPQEYVAFVQAFQERSKHVSVGKNIWIMKPVALSRGRGISLVNDLSDVVYGEQVVIQEYISNPLLLDGFKFDLRLYVLVTSFNPLEVFFYEEGFVRMCTRAYEDSDLTNLFIHLTNSSIQKENQDAIAANPDNPINSAEPNAEAGGTKMTLAYLWKRLEAMGADVATVKNDILTVILKALVCGEDHIPYQVNSFDLYGYDILLDTNFRPWLIEINSSPSMARENDLDYRVKDALIYDTLKLVNPLHFDRSKLVDVIARRFHDADVDKKRSHANPRHPKEAEALAARQLNEDLTDILRGHVPREYGELPDHMGSFTRIAPHTTIHNQLIKLKKSCLRLDRK